MRLLLVVSACERPLFGPCIGVTSYCIPTLTMMILLRSLPMSGLIIDFWWSVQVGPVFFFSVGFLEAYVGNRDLGVRPELVLKSRRPIHRFSNGGFKMIIHDRCWYGTQRIKGLFYQITSYFPRLPPPTPPKDCTVFYSSLAMALQNFESWDLILVHRSRSPQRDLCLVVVDLISTATLKYWTFEIKQQAPVTAQVDIKLCKDGIPAKAVA